MAVVGMVEMNDCLGPRRGELGWFLERQSPGFIAWVEVLDGLPVGVAALSSPFFPSLKNAILVITSIRHCVYCAGSERKGWKEVGKKRPRQCMTDVTSSPVYLLSSEMFLGHAVEIKC